MNRLGILFTKPNSTLTFKVNAQSGLSTFLGVLKRYDTTGGGTVETWTPAELLAGVTAPLSAAKGYDMLIIPQPLPAGGSLDMVIDVVHDKDAQKVSANSQESIGWSIFFN